MNVNLVLYLVVGILLLVILLTQYFNIDKIKAVFLSLLVGVVIYMFLGMDNKDDISNLQVFNDIPDF